MQRHWQSTRNRFGEILVEEGIFTKEEMLETFEQQQESGVRLGEFLIRKGVLRENQLVEMVSRRLNIIKYDIDRHSPNPQLQSVIPPAYAKQYNVVPLSKKGNVLYVVMTDPFDTAALVSLEATTKYEIYPVICTWQELTDLTYDVYGISAELQDGLEIHSPDHADAEPEEVEDQKDITVFSLEGLAQDPPVIRLVNSILTRASREGASDIHISPEKKYVQMRYRVDGKLRQVPAPPKNYFLPIVSRFKILAGLDIAVSRIPQDGRFSFNIDEREIHVRVSTLPTIHGENIVLRLLEIGGNAQSIQQLGLSDLDYPKVEEAIFKPWGMLLATGPTGSGKSTSLYAMLSEINQPDVNIVTLEDPVEYRIEKIRQVQLNRKAGMTFASGLRSILRQDPDVVMVGEIRDNETANIAVQAALTGHRLFSTLHTNDASSAVTRLGEMGVEPFLVSSTLLISIAQRLLRKVCDHCKQPYTPSPGKLKAMGIRPGGDYNFMKGQGCNRCHDLGFSGRIGVFEVLEIDEEVQDLILRKSSSTTITRQMVKAGKLRTLKMDGAQKAIQGITTLEEAASITLM